LTKVEVIWVQKKSNLTTFDNQIWNLKSEKSKFEWIAMNSSELSPHRFDAYVCRIVHHYLCGDFDSLSSTLMFTIPYLIPLLWLEHAHARTHTHTRTHTTSLLPSLTNTHSPTTPYFIDKRTNTLLSFIKLSLSLSLSHTHTHKHTLSL